MLPKQCHHPPPEKSQHSDVISHDALQGSLRGACMLPLSAREDSRHSGCHGCCLDVCILLRITTCIVRPPRWRLLLQVPANHLQIVTWYSIVESLCGYLVSGHIVLLSTECALSSGKVIWARTHPTATELLGVGQYDQSVSPAGAAARQISASHSGPFFPPGGCFRVGKEQVWIMSMGAKYHIAVLAWLSRCCAYPQTGKVTV